MRSQRHRRMCRPCDLDVPAMPSVGLEWSATWLAHRVQLASYRVRLEPARRARCLLRRLLNGQALRLRLRRPKCRRPSRRRPTGRLFRRRARRPSCRHRCHRPGRRRLRRRAPLCSRAVPPRRLSRASALSQRRRQRCRACFSRGLQRCSARLSQRVLQRRYRVLGRWRLCNRAHRR